MVEYKNKAYTMREFWESFLPSQLAVALTEEA